MPTPLSPSEQAIRDAIAPRRDELIHDLGAHVAIPTGHNHTPGLDEYRAVVVARLQALGASVEKVPGEPRPEWMGAAKGAIPHTVILRSEAAQRAAPGAMRILIAGHLDTVFPPDGDFTQMMCSVDGRTAKGPGVVDMKGGVLIAIAALEALHACGVEVAWTAMFNSDEETGSYHSDSALRAEAPKHDLGIAVEPALAGGELAIERYGSGQFIIEAHGRSAHVGREFEKGVSAVHALAKAIDKACDLADPAKQRIVSVGPLEGGKATNVVPDLARAWGNARYPTPEIGREIGEALDALATPEDAMPRVIVRRSFNRPAKPLIPATERLALAARDAAESLGQRLPFASTGGVCDGNILQDAGLPTVDTLGVRGGRLHTTEEWIELDSLVERATLLGVLLARLSRSAVR